MVGLHAWVAVLLGVVGAGAACGCSKDVTVDTTTPYTGPVAANCAGHEAGASRAVVGMGDGKTCITIDRMEVTRAEFDAFVAAKPTVTQPAECAGNDVASAPCEPADARFPVAAEPGSPVVCVDWCDAWAYCAFKGARLCTGSSSNPEDPAASEWYAACSSAGSSTYPYGNQADPGACWVLADTASCTAASPCSAKAASDNPKCATPGGAINLSGNVAEWTAECSGSECLVRGGSYLDGMSETTCKSSEYRARAGGYATVGFRCCAP